MNAKSAHPRSTVVSFLGAVVRPLGGWMPIAAGVDLLAELGLDAPSVRTAVFRLKKNGWLIANSEHGARGYGLTDLAQATLAAGDEVIWHARRPADLQDGWCIVHFGVPETLRSRRQQLRAHLTHLGFGNVGTALWIAPARMRGAAEHAVTDLELTGHTAIFTGEYHGPQDLADMLYGAWDLSAIDQGYRDFIDVYADRATELAGLRGATAFVSYLELIDRWRRLPFRDPGLPADVLDPAWSGPQATALFEDLAAGLEKPALDYARTHWPRA